MCPGLGGKYPVFQFPWSFQNAWKNTDISQKDSKEENP